jgi:hypothetical protein
MTTTTFDATIIDRIAANPNPHAPGRVKRFLTWGRRFVAELDREAARDSARNVLAVVGFGTVIGDFATMRVWMALPMAAVAAGVWYIDYMRHF